jgi:hypothetical protein
MSKTGKIQVPKELFAKLLHSNDLWQIRCLAMASMLAPMGIDPAPILEGDKDTSVAYLMRSSVSTGIEGVEFTPEELLDIFQAPITGENDATAE